MCVTLLFAIGNICMSGTTLENGNFSCFKRKGPSICEIRILCYNSLWLSRMGYSNKTPSDFCGFIITHRFLSQTMHPFAARHTHQQSRQVEVKLVGYHFVKPPALKDTRDSFHTLLVKVGAQPPLIPRAESAKPDMVGK